MPLIDAAVWTAGAIAGLAAGAGAGVAGGALARGRRLPFWLCNALALGLGFSIALWARLNGVSWLASPAVAFLAASLIGLRYGYLQPLAVARRATPELPDPE